MSSEAREIFAKRQAEMTARWFEGVKRKTGDVDAYIDGRKAAYNGRWNEALRFMPYGSRVLDIGGGNLYPELLELIRSKNIDYWFIDVDEGVVAGSRNLAEQHGFKGDQFRRGFNDVLPYKSDFFDAVFSSHCIEHSFDLVKTFGEINRILKHNGALTMAVPFGWEHNPEHPYFFEEGDWLSLIEDAGFQIRLSQIGREYPENGYDLFIAARKLSEPAHGRIDPTNYMKQKLTYISPHDEALTYSGNVERQDEQVICRDEWLIEMKAARHVKRILPIFSRHPWSGVIRLRCGATDVVRDLFSWYSYAQPIAISADGDNTTCRIEPIGRNPLSKGREGVLVGVLLEY